MKPRRPLLARLAPALLVLVGAAFVAPCARAQDATPPEPPVLRVLCWDNYFAPTTLADFEKETGARVLLDTYESNEALQQRLLGGLVGIDVIFPSDYMVKRLSDQGILAELDAKRLPNATYLSARFLKLPCDRQNRYCLPYLWGTTGVGANRSKVSGNPESLAILFRPESAGQVMLPDDARSSLGMALKYLGKSVNTRNKAEIAEAVKLLRDTKPRISEGGTAAMIAGLVDGSVVLVLGYNGDVLTARQKNAAVFYAVPTEGTILWSDHMCILKASDQQDLAHRFLDYLMRPEVAAAVTNATSYASANEAALPLVKPEILKDRAVHPSQRVLDKSEFLEPLGAAEALYEAAWREVTGR